MNKRWSKDNIPHSAAKLVVAICADKRRRDRILIHGDASPECVAVFTKYNTAIDLALLSVEVGIREDLFSDICTGVGYRRSKARPLVGQHGYYSRKHTVIYKIATYLNIV